MWNGWISWLFLQTYLLDQKVSSDFPVQFVNYIYAPCFNKVERGVYWFHLVSQSVCPSICGQNHVSSVSPTILIGSFSYLYILSSNFRSCVTSTKFQNLNIGVSYHIVNKAYCFTPIDMRHSYEFVPMALTLLTCAGCTLPFQQMLHLPMCIYPYPMLCADSRFWLVNNHEIWRRISRLTSSAWDIKTKERHWWCHNGDSDRRLLSLPLRYDLVTLCLCGDFVQINVIAGILKLQKCFRMSQILFEHGINSLSLVCFRRYGNLSTLSITIPRLAFGRAWYCDAACG